MTFFRSNERSMEGRVRNPLKYKGLRTRLRTRLSLFLPRQGFRFRTDIERHPKRLVIIITRGTDDDVNSVKIVINGAAFEGLPIAVVDRR